MKKFFKKNDVEHLVSEALELLEAGQNQAAESKLKQATQADSTHAQA